jgi:SpoVK/Ycf46/Vps4 family AAA+-type ATPase
LSARAWGLVLVRELEIVDWNKEAYKKLQIDDEIKTTIYQVVRGHSAHANDFDDFIRGKGRGLVFLLHGPPGCGKTMTAESIADSLRRPLYSVNGGELGTSPTTIQNALEGIFELVSRWDAIFLLDEADAFLSKRSNSVEKNAPISVFLRVLEYQAGVIFLTTNRLPDIDDAFHSRIHASIAYAPLDAEKTRAIWKELAFEKCGYRLSDDEVAELVALTMDGRTIKNVLRLAVLFAKARGEEEDMTFGDIKAVLPLLARAGVVRGPGG